MKKALVLMVLAGLFLTGCAAQAAQTSVAVQIPEALSQALGVLVLAALTAGFAFIFAKIGLDLRGYATPLAVTLSAFLVAQLQNLINIIPAQYDLVVTIVLKIIVDVIGGIGVLYVMSKFAPKQNGENRLI